jgi:copper chaperone CopZ
MSTQTFAITGLTCGHCVHSVTEEVSALAGVESVAIDLVAGGTSTLTVSSAEALSDEAIAAALDEAGAYSLAG